jgi:hypothetical protein
MTSAEPTSSETIRRQLLTRNIHFEPSSQQYGDPQQYGGNMSQLGEDLGWAEFDDLCLIGSGSPASADEGNFVVVRPARVPHP